MPQITRPTLQLSLLVTPASDRARDRATLEARIDYLDAALDAVRELALFWSSQRGPHDSFEDFEARQIEALRQVGRASAELALALAEAKDRREREDSFDVGGMRFRMSSPEPRSLNTWFGTVRYSRSYARPVEGGAGWFPLDAELGLLGKHPPTPSRHPLRGQVLHRESFISEVSRCQSGRSGPRKRRGPSPER